MINTASNYWRGLSVKVRLISTVAGAAGAIAGMVVAVPPAWSIIGLPEVATRGWVITEIRHPMRVAQMQTQQQVIDLQVDVANGKLDQLDNARATLEIERLKSTDNSVKARIDTQIHKIDRDTAAITDQIKTLHSLRTQP